jgi:hypothetical protein
MALWFRRARDYLRRRWTAQHGVEAFHESALPRDHAFHWVLDQYGGGPQPCCPWHEARLFQPQPGPVDRRSFNDITRKDDRAAQYIAERLSPPRR